MGLFLSNVKIKNFRNLSEFSAIFAPGLNVVVGENNIGKTNLLDAIRLALGAAASVGDPIRVSRDDRHRKIDGSYVDEPIVVDLTFSGLNAAERAEFVD